MKHTILFALFLGMCTAAVAQQKTPDARIEYIKKYKDAAIDEMGRSGVPASITLAQGIVESNAGQSTLAMEANNHFGIKCGTNWDGKSYYTEDDDRDNNNNIIKSCFRKYKSVDRSFKDHSDFLTDPKKFNRYGFLFQLNQQDYRSWCYGLQSAGYATAETYAQTLISVIETYRLFEYDKASPGEIAPVIANRRAISRVNDVKVVQAKEGETIEDIARVYRLSADKLMDYNEGGYTRADKLKAGTRIFLQKKAKKWHGRNKFHFVKENQTIFDIAQLYGMKQECLLKGNKMDEGEQAANGQQVRLKGYFWKKGPKPKLRRLEDGPNKPNNTTPTNAGDTWTTGDPKNTGKPNTGKPNSGSTKPSTTEPSKMTTDEDELFEMGENGVKEDPNKTKPSSTGSNIPTVPNKPSTTGTPIPNEPRPSTGTTTWPSDTQVTPPAPPKPPRTAGGTYHTIVKGDTLYNVSKRYNTTVAKIRQLNNMADDNIKIGQELRVN
jgi:LysM repeat protein